MKKNFKKILAGIMSCMLIVTNVSPVMAEDNVAITQDITDDNANEITIDLDSIESTEITYEDLISTEKIEDDTEIVEEDITTEEVIDVVTEDTTTTEESTDLVTEEITTTEDKSDEVTTEVTTKEDITTEEVTSETIVDEKNDNFIIFDHYYSTIDTSLINTSDLMIQTDNPEVFTKNTNVISNYDNVYMISCASIEEARYVYSYYIDKVDFISDMSNVFSLTNEDDIADLSEVNNDSDDAIAQLNDISTKSYEGYIALIDTGADADVKMSVLDDDGSDTVGHGTKMLSYIKEEDPNAKVLSIKAFDGKSTNIANIYAAIQLAIDSKVSIINLSFVGPNIKSNRLIKDLISNAIGSGITVVGAAGNNGNNVNSYIPGCIDAAIVVGYCDENGNINSSSNYGSNVDYYVVANSSSEATARMSGIISSNNGISTNKVYYIPSTECEPSEVVFENDEFTIAWAPGNPDPSTSTYIKLEDYSTHAYFNYYYNNKIFDSKLTKEGYNALCVNHNRPAGIEGYCYDATFEEWTNTKLKQLVYNCLKDSSISYHQMHLLVCYYLYESNFYTTGNSGATLSDANVTNDTYTKLRDTAIPSNTTVQTWFVRNSNEDDRTDSKKWQNFMTWRVTVENDHDYFIAVKKVDEDGHAINNVTFDVYFKVGNTIYRNGKKNGSTDEYKTDKSKVFSGYLTTFTDKDSQGYYATKSIKGNSGQVSYGSYTISKEDGLAVIYLGSFSQDPTDICVREHWVQDEAQDGIAGTIIYYEDGARKSRTVYPDDFKAYYGGSITSDWVDIASASKDAIPTSSAVVTFENEKDDHKDLKIYLTKKVSTDCAELVKNNPNYSLTGTTYALYKGTKKIGTFTIGSDGNSSVLNVSKYMITNELDEYLPTTFTLKETKTGKGYSKSSDVSVTLTAADEGKTKNITVYDDAKGDPFVFALQKINSYTGEYPTTVNDSMSFKVTYYPVQVPNQGHANEMLTAKALASRTGTSHTYTATLSDLNANTIRVKASDFNANWDEFPYGYLVIEEFTAPAGYNKTDDFMLKFTDGSNVTYINLNEKPTFMFTSYGTYLRDDDSALSLENMSLANISVVSSDGYDLKIETSMLTSETNTQLGTLLNDTQTLTDTVYYWNIPKDENLTIKGELVDVDEYIASGTKKVIATATTTAKSSDYKTTKATADTATLTYTFDTSKNVNGHRLASVVSVYSSANKLVKSDNDAFLKVSSATRVNEALINAETIYYPSGKTNAYSAATSIKTMGKGENTRIMDVVTLTNLLVGKDYTINAKVMERTVDGTAIAFESNDKAVERTISLKVDANGNVTATDITDANNPITLTTDFTKNTDNGNFVSGRVRLEIYVNASEVEDKTTTVFEDIYMGDVKIIAHDNIDDVNQQVHFMKIETDLVDSSYVGDNDNVGVKREDDTLIDTITLTKIAAPFNNDGINRDTVITIEGVLKDKSTGEDFVYADGSKITARGTISISKDGVTVDGDIDPVTENLVLDPNTNTYNGTVDLKFTFDSSNFGKLTLVSFVRALVTNSSGETVPVAVHDDINDLRESVSYTKIETQFHDIVTDSDVPVTGKITAYDRVKIDNLIYDKEYEVVGAIQKKDMEGNHLGALTDEDGNDVVVKTTVTVTDDGEVIAPDAYNLQFVKDNETKTVSGTLDLYFSIDTEKLQGEDIVAFETLEHKGITIDFHADLKDEDQTMHVPKGGTTAIDKDTQDKVATVKEDEDTTISDKVSLENLSNGNTYYVYGKLMDKSTSYELLVDDNIVTSSCTFRVLDNGEIDMISGSDDFEFTTNANDTVSGYVTLDFTFSSKNCANKDIVVFETGYFVNDNDNTKVKIFEEDDITNLDQTVHFTDIKTLATDDTYKGHIGLVNEVSTLTEKSMLYNLSYGQTYEVTATLVDKITGEDIIQDGQKVQRKATITISDDGQTVTAVDSADDTIEFVVGDIVLDDNNDTLDMFVEIPMTFDSSVVAGKTTVVYEDLDHKDVTIRVHRETDDIDEQIHYYKLTILKTGLKNPINAKFTVTHDDAVVYFHEIEDGLYYVAAEEDETTVTVIKPGKDGNLVINGFNQGEYEFTEIQTENGHNLLKSAFIAKFTPTSDEDGLLYEFSIEADGEVTVIEKDSEDMPNAVTFGVNNSEVVSIFTGGSGTYGFYIAGLVVLMLAVVAGIIYKKKKRS